VGGGGGVGHLGPCAWLPRMVATGPPTSKPFPEGGAIHRHVGVKKKKKQNGPGPSAGGGGPLFFNMTRSVL